MNFEYLVKQLDNPTYHVRIATLHILNMVDEVRALDAISARVPIETDARVDPILKQVGRTLNKLKREGYDTIDAICQHFGVYSEVLSHANLLQIARIKEAMQKEGKHNPDIEKIAALLLAGEISGTIDTISLNNEFPRRTRATRMTNEHFETFVPRLKSPVLEERRQTLIHLANRNNPLVLQYFAQVRVTDSDESIRDTAKRLGKMLYWNIVYGQMEDDGSLSKLMLDYAEKMGISLPPKYKTQTVPTLGEVLKKPKQN